MTIGDRVYNKSSDKQWSSEVYQKAKVVIKEVLSVAGSAVPSSQINEAMRQKYPSLCDDRIRDRQSPTVPYWKHRVASAISTLQRQGKVSKAGNGWIWTGVKPPPPPSEPDKLAEEIKGLIEKLVELAEKSEKMKIPPLTPAELGQKIVDSVIQTFKLKEEMKSRLEKLVALAKKGSTANP